MKVENDKCLFASCFGKHKQTIFFARLLSEMLIWENEKQTILSFVYEVGALWSSA